VGIERMHCGAFGKELCCEFKGTKITEDSESSARRASSRCIGAQEKKTELLNVL
jgi:hypothetical protein